FLIQFIFQKGLKNTLSEWNLPVKVVVYDQKTSVGDFSFVISHIARLRAKKAPKSGVRYWQKLCGNYLESFPFEKITAKLFAPASKKD
ncbi:MAG: hypothetical protein HQK83_17960, partial [Fibrobacteria bacterium]|nr:hypothetical protein [Fibrobacteria bacterium]